VSDEGQSEAGAGLRVFVIRNDVSVSMSRANSKACVNNQPNELGGTPNRRGCCSLAVWPFGERNIHCNCLAPRDIVDGSRAVIDFEALSRKTKYQRLGGSISARWRGALGPPRSRSGKNRWGIFWPEWKMMESSQDYACRLESSKKRRWFSTHRSEPGK